MGSVGWTFLLFSAVISSNGEAAPSYFGFSLGDYIKESEVLNVDDSETAESNRYVCFSRNSGDSSVVFLDWQRGDIRFSRFMFLFDSSEGYKCNLVENDEYTREFDYGRSVFQRLASDDFTKVRESSDRIVYRKTLEKEEGCFDYDGGYEGPYSIRGSIIRYLTINVYKPGGTLSRISESVGIETNAEEVYAEPGCG